MKLSQIPEVHSKFVNQLVKGDVLLWPGTSLAKVQAVNALTPHYLRVTVITENGSQFIRHLRKTRKITFKATGAVFDSEEAKLGS